MSFPTIESLLSPHRIEATRDELAARRAATEFEALLLAQLTAHLQPPADNEEEGLFQSSATDLYRQMFGEQIASTIAKSGRIGLADLILRQIQTAQDKARTGWQSFASRMEAVRQMLNESSEASSAASINPTEGAASNSAMSESGRAAPVALQLPLLGRITSTFGARRDPINGRYRKHQGVDIAAPAGSPISAAAEGTVIFAGRQRGYGNTVVIAHADGRQTRYAHAARLLVAAGEQVAAGQTIATVGRTGRATGPHLHFEVAEQGRRVNPLGELANVPRRSRR
jgi:murein DD-endopeptidase MepM/ murein hydrolase activator NlpD